MKLHLDEIKDKLKSLVDSDRYLHTLGTLHTSMILADKWGADLEKTATASLLHDCAKCYKSDKMESLIREFGLFKDELDFKFPKLWHAFLGSHIAKEYFGVDDEEIIESIYMHPTGCPNMTLLQKIIFISDYCEPLRKGNKVNYIKEAALEDIDKAVSIIADSKIKYLSKNLKNIHPRALETYNYYCKSSSKKEEVQ